MTPEHERARQWREARGLSLDQLADLTGYTTLAIRWFEKGLTPPRRRKHEPDDRSINEWVWQRYRNCCAAVDHRLRTGEEFKW